MYSQTQCLAWKRYCSQYNTSLQNFAKTVMPFEYYTLSVQLHKYLLPDCYTVFLIVIIYCSDILRPQFLAVFGELATLPTFF
jgi:hypothetical protein